MSMYRYIYAYKKLRCNLHTRSLLSEVITSDEVLNLKEVPNFVVVIGGEVVDMEFAAIYNAVGCKVQ